MSLRSAIIYGVAEEISNISKGTKLLHEVLAEKLEESTISSKYYDKISSLKKVLKKNYSIFLEQCHGEGYFIVETDKSWNYLSGGIERAKRNLCNKFDDTKYMPVNDMSEQARNEAFTGMQKNSTLMIMLNVGSNVKELKE